MVNNNVTSAGRAITPQGKVTPTPVLSIIKNIRVWDLHLCGPSREYNCLLIACQNSESNGPVTVHKYQVRYVEFVVPEF